MSQLHLTQSQMLTLSPQKTQLAVLIQALIITTIGKLICENSRSYASTFHTAGEVAYKTYRVFCAILGELFYSSAIILCVFLPAYISCCNGLGYI